MKTSNFQKNFSNQSHIVLAVKVKILSLTLFEKLSLVNPTNWELLISKMSLNVLTVKLFLY